MAGVVRPAKKWSTIGGSLPDTDLSTDTELHALLAQRVRKIVLKDKALKGATFGPTTYEFSKIGHEDLILDVITRAKNSRVYKASADLRGRFTQFGMLRIKFPIRLLTDHWSGDITRRKRTWYAFKENGEWIIGNLTDPEVKTRVENHNVLEALARS